MTERGFSDDDDPRRDFMATYFDHDDEVTRGMVGDYLDRIEVAAVQADRERMARAVERGEWDDVFVESFNSLRSEMYLPAHIHNDHPCVGCDLLRRLTAKTLVVR